MLHASMPQLANPGSSAAIFLVVIASYVIAWWSSRRQRDTRVNTYLFAGNTATLGLSSSVGTIISMAVGFTALLSAGFVFGWQILFSIFPGGAAGAWVILRFANSQAIRNGRREVFAEEFKYGASYLALLSKHRKKSFLTYYSVAMAFYAIMLATEVAVLRGFLKFFLSVDGSKLMLLILVVISVCVSYVYIGGFRGVLVTDYFQLLVVIAFIGSALPHIFRQDLFASIPSPTVAAVHWTPPSLVLLHIGSFFGAFAWTAGNLDQWLRTIGTLHDPAAQRTLRFAAIVTYLSAVLPVLAGSVAVARGLPKAAGNTASLHILLILWHSSDATGRFLFVMTIGCAALTTLNTYVMTMQQIYYEFSVSMVAETSTQYIAEWLLKFRSVRKVVFIVTAGAVAASLLISDHDVYAVGVLASCGYIFFALPIIRAIAIQHDESDESKIRFSDATCLLWALISFPVILLILRSWIGPIAIHLYLLPAAAGIAISIAIIVAILAPDEEEVP